VIAPTEQLIGGCRYTQFCERFRGWQRRSRPPRMRQLHRDGEALELDRGGRTLTVIDAGIARAAQVFVACLPCSDLTPGALEPGTRGLAAHVGAFAYIGGCPETLVPDGVTDANYWGPVLNRSYHDHGSTSF
jgi:transposase